MPAKPSQAQEYMLALYKQMIARGHTHEAIMQGGRWARFMSRLPTAKELEQLIEVVGYVTPPATDEQIGVLYRKHARALHLH